MGFNFYHSNQWEYEGERLKWEEHPRDARWTPLHAQLFQMWTRYRRPVVLAETSHIGVGRGPWIAEIGDEVAKTLDAGVPLKACACTPSSTVTIGRIRGIGTTAACGIWSTMAMGPTTGW